MLRERHPVLRVLSLQQSLCSAAHHKAQTADWTYCTEGEYALQTSHNAKGD